MKRSLSSALLNRSKYFLEIFKSVLSNCEIWILITSVPCLYIFCLRGQKCFPILQAEFRDRLGKVVRLEEAPLYRMSSCY